LSKNLVYYFDLYKHLEVEMTEGKWKGEWNQVTCATFRSYAGGRRINGEPYEGPILYHDTNFLYEGPLTGKIVFLEEGEDIRNLRKVRKNSRFSYSNEWAEC
jgi:hypothetical protein